MIFHNNTLPVYFPGDPVSNTFVIKNLTTTIDISDSIPLRNRNELGDHLSRIKYYRNIIFHSKQGTISNTDFATCWEEIAIVRIIQNISLPKVIQQRV